MRYRSLALSGLGMTYCICHSEAPLGAEESVSLSAIPSEGENRRLVQAHCNACIRATGSRITPKEYCLPSWDISIVRPVCNDVDQKTSGVISGLTWAASAYTPAMYGIDQLQPPSR